MNLDEDNTLNRKLSFFCASLVATSSFSVYGGDWKSLVDKVSTSVGASTVSTGAAVGAGLSDSEVATGLKEALGNGVRSAISSLGQTDGFLGNQLVRIAVPDSVQPLAKAARQFGAGQYVDNFEVTMNRAAERAVPEAADIFATSIENMSIEDARKILAGGDTAATDYFKRNASERLVEKFRPIVESATSDSGVASAYKSMAGQAGPLVDALGGSDVMDLDGYVTNKAVDGLFALIAQEEKRIRENPIARTSDLLKRVFE